MFAQANSFCFRVSVNLPLLAMALWAMGGAAFVATLPVDAVGAEAGPVRTESARDPVVRDLAAQVPAVLGQHWSFRPITRPAAPDVRDGTWPRGAIVRFILSRLENEGLTPTTDADRETLLRRVTFDLVGLPPSTAQLDAFLTDPSPNAFSRVVDRLLLSRHFGERWGRHWLDVVRFAESSGGGRSLMYPQAWRYRDYVISAFNDDLPFDRFVMEQIAGDLMPAETPLQRDRQAVATGLLVLGAINYELQDKELLDVEIADEQIDTVSRALLGMTVGCARCHDHKFDPIPTEEYYGLAGIFLSTKSVLHSNVGKPMETPLEHGPEVIAYRQFELQLKGARDAWKQARQELVQLKKTDGQAPVELAAQSSDQPGGVESEPAAADTTLTAMRKEVERLEQQMKRIERAAPLRPVAMAVADADEPGDAQLLLAGSIREHGGLVPRCVLSAATIAGAATAIETQGSGRWELARWIASPQNPLTARVIVNRVWGHLLGAGLVRTVDNLGSRGELPSHPQLLDWLTTSFIEDGWSVKALVRRIVRSRTYQLASRLSAEAAAVDPDNRLLALANLRRLDVEALRDAVLSVSGQLDLTPGGLAIRKLAAFDHGYQYQSVRRSVYVPRFRGTQLDMFDVFDVANPNMVCGRRSVSVLPTQALYMMNSDFLVSTAKAAAGRLLADVNNDDPRIDLLMRRALGRLPTTAERQVYHDYLKLMRAESVDDPLAVWSGLCQLVFASVDFRYLN